MNRVFSCDFETTTGERTNVWLWGAYDIFTGAFEWGETIEGFTEFIAEEPTTAYFHNLGFDGIFLLDYYLKNGFSWVEKGKLKSKQLQTTISDKGQFYKMSVNYGNMVTYKDSYKIIPIGVAKISKAFGFGMQKLEMNYSAHKYGEYLEPTEDDIEYLRHDCEIVGRALAVMISQGMSKLTTGANAMGWYKANTPEYDKWFPTLTPDQDDDIRKAYRGAWTYCNPLHKGELKGSGQVYDINSMYAWAMRYPLLPYGSPIWFDGEPEDSSLYPLWIAAVKIDCQLKPGMFPCIQLKKNPRYVPTEYIEKTKGPTTMHITNVDFKLISDTYDIVYIEWLGGYKFMGSSELFAPYIDYWYDKKAQHTLEKNEGLRYIDKQMLVNLYGKFGTNPAKDIKMPYIEDEKVKFKIIEKPKEYKGYLPVAVFITSYCRDKIIRDACKMGDRFAYADTDSLHILGDELPDIPIDDVQLGAYKCEGKFTQAMYGRSKLYIETIAGKMHKAAAGLPEKARGPLSYDTLRNGMEFKGKLVHTIVPGGAILRETTFKVKL